jgi:TPR repeat protein
MKFGLLTLKTGDRDLEKDRIAAEAEYRAWLEAAAVAAGGRRSLNSRIAEKIKRRTPGIDAKIRGWTNPASLKIPQLVTNGTNSELAASLDLNTALTSTIIELLPHRETEFRLKDFSDLLSEIRRLRTKSQIAGVHKNQNSNLLFEQKVLGLPIVIAKDVEPKRLNLGSGLLDGEIPEYCSREIDHILMERLNNPLVDLITISGEPKSGKTRTLIHNLQNSILRDAEVYWLRPGAALSALAESLAPKNKLHTVTIIDDIQRWVQLSGTLPGQDLQLLRKKSKVLVTVHHHDIAQWKLSSIDHSVARNRSGAFGPGDDFVEQIENSMIYLDSELSEDELTRAMALENDASVEQLRSLGAYYSSSEFLLSKFDSLFNSSEPLMVATLKAVFGSRILHSAGVTVDALEELARAELSALNKGAYFSKSRFEEILANDLTTGVSLKSPHSILTATPDNSGTYSIFDPLWMSIRESIKWQAPTEILTLENSVAIADAIIEAGFPDAALKVLNLYPQEISAQYCFAMSSCYWELGQEDLWRHWIEKAVDLNHAVAMSNLAYVLQNSDRKRSLHLLNRSAKLGEPEAFNGLGVLHSAENKPKAEVFYRKAIELGNISALFNLAVDLESTNWPEASDLYQRSLKAGDKRAFYAVALQRLEDDHAEAERLFELAGINGDARGFTQIGNIYISSDPPRAESYYRKAADLGETTAMNNLGVLISDRDQEAANKLYEAALADNPVAGRNLAMAIRDTQRDKALALFEQSANMGDCFSMNELGHMLIGYEDEKARFWLEEAVALHEYIGKINLAWLLREEHKQRSITLLKEVTEAKDIDRASKAEALYGLGMHFEIEHPQSAFDYFLRASDLGLAKATRKVEESKAKKKEAKSKLIISQEAHESGPQIGAKQNKKISN